MDNFQLGIIFLQIIILIAFLVVLINFIGKIRFSGQQNINNKKYIYNLLEEYSLDIFDKIEEIHYELEDDRDNMRRFAQQQISWQTVKKELPSPLRRVLLLEDEIKTEHEGFLNASQESWTVQSLHEKNKYLTLDLGKISHWKPLVKTKKKALNPKI